MRRRCATLALVSIREWHFVGPVFLGDTLHVRSKVLEKEVRSRGRRGVITWGREIFNQADKVVQHGVTVTLVEGRGGLQEHDASASKHTANSHDSVSS